MIQGDTEGNGLFLYDFEGDETVAQKEPEITAVSKPVPSFVVHTAQS